MVPSDQPVPAQASQSDKAASDAAWESSFARLLEFHRQHGHFHVPLTDPEHKSLHWWAAHQRQHLSAGAMPPERRQRLESLGFPGESRFALQARNCGRIWDQHFAELMAFYRLHGHFRVRCKCAQPAGLREWVNHQRRQYYSGRLHPDRRQRLAAVGFFMPRPATMKKSPPASTGTEQSQPVDPLISLETIPDDPHPADPWDAKYHDLAAFHKRFGHCYVPYPWPEQPGLGIWVQAQRRQRETLSAEHIARLDEIHFIWTGGWEVLGEDWRQKQKEVMGLFYRDPEMPPEHYQIYRKPVIHLDEDDLQSC